VTVKTELTCLCGLELGIIDSMGESCRIDSVWRIENHWGFDELCRRSLMFIDKCFFHSLNLVKFVVRYEVLFGRYKSVIGSK